MSFAKYVAMFRIGLLESLAYRYDIMFSSVGSLIYVFTFVYLWRVIYETYALPGFTLAELLWYFMLVQGIRFSAGKPVEEITRLIQTGDIANFVNKPFSLLWYQFFQSLGRTLLSLFSVTLFGSLLVWTYYGAPPVVLYSLPIVFVVIIVGIIINFLINFGIALLAFWTEDAAPFYWIYDKAVFILGGLLFPLELLPGLLQKIAGALPTAYYLYHPAKLFVHFSWQTFSHVIFVQAVFVVVLLAGVSIMMHYAMKKLSINGG